MEIKMYQQSLESTENNAYFKTKHYAKKQFTSIVDSSCPFLLTFKNLFWL